MAKLFTISHSVSWRITLFSFFFPNAFSNAFKFKDSSRVNSSFIVEFTEDNLIFYTGQMFFAEDVEDGKQSDTSVDVTYTSVCHARLRLFQSQIRSFSSSPLVCFAVPKITVIICKQHFFIR